MACILIAEADDDCRRCYQQFFIRKGYEVQTAKDGLECLARLRQSVPDVLLLDLHLPWGGGDGVLDWLRDGGAHFAVPVILTATADHPTPGSAAVAPPVVELLPKPFKLTTLAASVQTAIAVEPGRLNRSSQVSRPELYIG